MKENFSHSSTYNIHSLILGEISNKYDDDWDAEYHNVKSDQTDDSQFAFDGYPDWWDEPTWYLQMPPD